VFLVLKSRDEQIAAFVVGLCKQPYRAGNLRGQGTLNANGDLEGYKVLLLNIEQGITIFDLRFFFRKSSFGVPCS